MTSTSGPLDEGPVTSDSSGSLPQGSPCDPFADECQPGLACVGIGGGMCNSMVACCTLMCDVSNGMECPAGLTCEPFYPPMMAPPGYELLGVCLSNAG